MGIHIGEIIHEKVKTSTLKIKEIVLQLNRSENTLYDIYTRESIDSQMLVQLSGILQFDFLGLYYNEEPLKSMVKNEVGKLMEEIAELKSALERKEDVLKDCERKNSYLKEDNADLQYKLSSLDTTINTKTTPRKKK